MLVNIIKIAYKRKSPVPVKKTYVTARLVAAIGSIAGVNTSKLAIGNLALGNNINSFYRIAVVKAR
ncbi:hypothetical protein LWM68_40450 [Niabella sp. W65]|nr:hypothetical protein [Niabella sp. W65]MCH7368454.1 hypothetical protein [Niabella sp. W65]ULT44051.1 hypothetical protein KRR40_12160 [Niabella sp. I65]